MIRSAACGFGYLALSAMAAQQVRGAAAAHFAPRARRVIFLFMQGGPSHVDTFDPKPRLDRDDGKTIDIYNSRHRTVRGEKLLKSPWSFARHGECGAQVSELLPNIARCVDDLCFVHSVHTEGVAHGPATLQLHTGATSLVRPSIGSWIAYGLGAENQNLPAFVTINPSANMGGSRCFSNAFLPSGVQGIPIGRAGMPAAQAELRHITNERLSPARQERQLRFLQAINRRQVADDGPGDELENVIDSFELAFRMQRHAPDILNLSGESRHTLELYGIGSPATDDFGRQCLMARRLAEAGVRYIQVNYADNSSNPRWDQHSRIMQHAVHARATDRPVAGLIIDLKRRGLLEDTLIWWGGEFGRTPFAEGKDGRDHNPTGFTVFLAGAGVKPGHSHGATDEIGHNAVEGKVHMYDLHATVLHLLGLDHERLTYRYAGRDFRLTDVHGTVVRDVLA